jgi:hypothetical protein
LLEAAAVVTAGPYNQSKRREQHSQWQTREDSFS